MPLTVKNILRIRKGKINTSADAVLTLGDSTHPGILVTTFLPPYQEDPWRFLETPYEGSVSDYNGGFVEGPMRRWYQRRCRSSSICRRSGVHHALQWIPCGYGFVELNLSLKNLVRPMHDRWTSVHLNNVLPEGDWRVTSPQLHSPFTPVKHTDYLWRQSGPDWLMAMIRRPEGVMDAIRIIQGVPPLVWSSASMYGRFQILRSARCNLWWRCNIPNIWLLRYLLSHVKREIVPLRTIATLWSQMIR